MFRYLLTILVSFWTNALTRLGIKSANDPLLPTASNASTIGHEPVYYDGLAYYVPRHALRRHKKMKAKADAKRKRDALKRKSTSTPTSSPILVAPPSANVLDISRTAALRSISQVSPTSSPEVSLISTSSGSASPSTPSTSPLLLTCILPPASLTAALIAIVEADNDSIGEGVHDHQLRAFAVANDGMIHSNAFISEPAKVSGLRSSLDASHGVYPFPRPLSLSLDMEETYPADDADSFHCRDAGMRFDPTLGYYDIVSEFGSNFSPPAISSQRQSLSTASESNDFDNNARGMEAVFQMAVDEAASRSRSRRNGFILSGKLDDLKGSPASDSSAMPVIRPLRIVKKSRSPSPIDRSAEPHYYSITPSNSLEPHDVTEISAPTSVSLSMSLDRLSSLFRLALAADDSGMSAS